MRFIADFHIHSKYSRATSRNLDLEHLYICAQKKGVQVVGTGDFTHPVWFAEISAKLVPAEPGLFKLRADLEKACDKAVPAACRQAVRFILTTEISNIYKKNEVTRKNHNLVFLPNLEKAALFNDRLDAIGNIHSDGRPILGLDARNLLEIVLETDDSGFLIPAHIWTPWFSLLGSKSGFDAIEECFEDLSDEIFALETGLSSDPPMNWMVSCLDGRTLVSNSDAHSPEKIGREANLFDTSLNYPAIRKALQSGDPKEFIGTFEFFPEEGKYHMDGHRKCGVWFDPVHRPALDNQCPVCGRALTQGVMYRVAQLADRRPDALPDQHNAFFSSIQLNDLISEIVQVGPQSKKVRGLCQQVYEKLGSELNVLHQMPPELIDRAGIGLLKEAILRMRTGKVSVEPGFDGQYGRVRLFSAQERKQLIGQKSLFVTAPEAPAKRPSKTGLKAVKKVRKVKTATKPVATKKGDGLNQWLQRLNPQQRQAVDHSPGALLIVAGPGTGKTATLTARIAHKVATNIYAPSQVLAITFTNKAAQQMRRRLEKMLGAGHRDLNIHTFHGFCLQLLLADPKSGPSFSVVDEEDRQFLLADVLAARPLQNKKVQHTFWLNAITLAKQHLLGPTDDLAQLGNWAAKKVDTAEFAGVYAAYQQRLESLRLWDFDDLIMQSVLRLESDLQYRRTCQQRFAHVYVDEYQDINYGQYRLIRAITAVAHPDVCAIGDPDQSIYGFRGSDSTYFERFSQDYDQSQTVYLKDCYRCTATIVDAALEVIALQSDQMPVRALRSVHPIGAAIELITTSSAASEAVAIGRRIQQLVGGTGYSDVDIGNIDSGAANYSFTDIAVLFRTNAQGIHLLEMLEKMGIACQPVSRQRFGGVRLVRQMVALLKIVHDRADRLVYENVQPLLAEAAAQLKENHSDGPVLDPVAKIQAALKGRPLAQKIQWLVDHTDLKTELQETGVPLLYDYLVQLADQHADLDDFLAAIALQSDTDIYAQKAERVSLITLHASKGLEFPVVFIAGCENDLIPYQRSHTQDPDLEEERRLFYVGMTRACQKLILTHACRRRRNGKSAKRKPSMFIDAIDRKRICIDDQSKAGVQRRAIQLALFDEPGSANISKSSK